MAIHTMAASFDDSEAFDKSVSDLIKRHKDRHVDPALWNVRLPVFSVQTLPSQHKQKKREIN